MIPLSIVDLWCLKGYSSFSLPRQFTLTHHFEKCFFHRLSFSSLQNMKEILQLQKCNFCFKPELQYMLITLTHKKALKKCKEQRKRSFAIKHMDWVLTPSNFFTVSISEEISSCKLKNSSSIWKQSLER